MTAYIKRYRSLHTAQQLTLLIERLSVNGRQQTAKMTSDFEFFSSNP